MNLGDKLIKLRKENKMSQDDLAESLGVTRQSISNWENYKNYPDINTIIKISDVFNVSLDVLLKSDTKMISEMDKKIRNSKKYKNILIIIGIILGIIILFFGIYTIIYFNTKADLEESFNQTLTENNFKKNRDGYYSMKYKKNIIFGVSNQKMSKLSSFDLHFYVQNLYCDIELDNGDTIKGLWVDKNNFIFTRQDKNDNIIGSTSSLKGKDKQDIRKLSEELAINYDYLKDIIETGNNLYSDFYKEK